MGDPELRKGKYEELFEVDESQHRIAIEASTEYTEFPVELDVPKKIKAYVLYPYFI